MMGFEWCQEVDGGRLLTARAGRLGNPWGANSMVRLAGFEPATYGLEVRCSIQLSYRRIASGPSAAFDPGMPGGAVPAAGVKPLVSISPFYCPQKTNRDKFEFDRTAVLYEASPSVGIPALLLLTTAAVCNRPVIFE